MDTDNGGVYWLFAASNVPPGISYHLMLVPEACNGGLVKPSHTELSILTGAAGNA